MAMASSKAALRVKVKDNLKQLLLSPTTSCESSYSSSSSQLLLSQLVALPEYISASCISVFLSMPTEIQTVPIIEHAMRLGKRVVVPKIVGSQAPDMLMIELSSPGVINTFPKSKWGIPEPPPEYIEKHPDLTSSGCIDLVIVPGVAFDRTCARLGHGKGYYDSFLSRLSSPHTVSDKYVNGNSSNSSSSSSSSIGSGGDSITACSRFTSQEQISENTIVSVGIGFDEQIIAHVPMDSNDRYLDYVITPTAKFSGRK